MPANTKPSTPLEMLRHVALVRNHAWLSRFAEANQENKYNRISPDAAHDIASHVNDLLDRMCEFIEQVEAKEKTNAQ